MSEQPTTPRAEQEPEAPAEAAAEIPAELSAEALAEVAEVAAPAEPATPAEVPVEPEVPTEAPSEPASAAAAPAPRPAPRPRPVPRPLPRPAPARPAPEGAAAPAQAPVAVRAASDPTPWGRVAEDGTVFVRTGEGERAVGSFPGASAQEALAHFGRRYDDLVAQVDLVEQRLAATDVSPADAVGTLRGLRAGLADAAAVGDLDGLAQRTRDLEQVAAQRRAEADAAREAAREAARAQRSGIVEEAERIAATDPAKMQWRPSGDRLRQLLEAWKEQQRSGARLDRRSEEELWKRFSAARTAFDRARRAWFSSLEDANSAARAAKEALVAEAEALSTSTDWGSTSTAYRRLMDRWRAAGRASRKDDDALWARFRAAQDAFFSARNAAQAEGDAEQGENLKAKEALLAEAEALLPVQDPRAARAALREIQERWEAAGKVPRADLGRVERRMRAVEQAVADADRERWQRSNPETRARAQGAVEQLERVVADLERDVADARTRGDARAEQQATASLEARRQWLEAARRTAQEFSG
ncbi:DUF349 domain-containing protein [Quadrisphaera sp. DSM 44207]|uniref:DUF349 domain-containing protein n=1 Tax=Quadrisphaera sp. DSM 44207 TaxID=1881057 RepID=UPI0008803C48|nr:DUF349 domain-containing protein [Quadrisphaera sp. DSM 44207]SDQ47543.1 protein of unknown function [Quadrisphaera sp. DSM 44207]